MKTELPCAVVRDLLPSYIDKLTEEETTIAVKNHLDSCQDCRVRYESMTEGHEIPQADIKEVDYLKTVRKKNRNRIIVSVAAAIVLVIGAVFAKLFLIGTAAEADSISTQVTSGTDSESVLVTFNNLDSAGVLTDIDIETNGDVIEITARKVLVSPVHPPEEVAFPVNLSGIREIRAFGEPIWRDGIVIEGKTGFLMDNRVEYVGEAPAVNNLISNMDFNAPHTLQLQTSGEPYGVTIHFTDVIQENRQFMIKGKACVLLALIDNLGKVVWDDPSGYSDSITIEDAESMLNESMEIYNRNHKTELVPLESIKDYSHDVFQLQVLIDILGV